MEKKIPVIIDTDIGSDIDDTWALCFALLRDELDIRLITTVLGDAVYSAKLIAKMNQCCGKGNIDIGLCSKSCPCGMFQEQWVEDYDLSSYEGKIYKDGVGRMIDVINDSKEMVTILAMGPCTNLAEAVRRDPGIADKVRVVAVFGALFRGYFGDEVCDEYNVKKDIGAARIFLSQYKNKLIVPIDTCFDAVIDGERFRHIKQCRKDNLAVNAVLENFEIWAANHPIWKKKSFERTSELCDTLTVYLAITNDGIINKNFDLEVNNDGYTIISENGVRSEVAIEWSDREHFLDFLVDTYCESSACLLRQGR